MLAIRRAGLPPSLLSSLKHLASLHNPEFYSRQQIGLSVWGAPRMLRARNPSIGCSCRGASPTAPHS